MDSRPFGERYDRIDDDEQAEALLDYLDGVEAVPEVRAAKQAASLALRLQPGDVVADIGCGTGVDLPFLAELVAPGGVVIGVDPSAAAIAAAERRMGGRTGVELCQAGVEALPFPNGHFHACRMDRTLQHVADPEAALREVRRVLREDGRLTVHENGLKLDLDDAALDVPPSALAGLRAADDQAWLPMMLPLVLSRSGFGHVQLDVSETHEHDLELVDRLLRLRPQLRAHAAEAGRPELEARWWEQLAGARLDLTTISVRIDAVAV